MSSKIGQELIVLVLGLFFGVKALADPHYDKTRLLSAPLLAKSIKLGQSYFSLYATRILCDKKSIPCLTGV